MHIAVNFSARQFFQPQFHETVMQVLHETGLPPGALEIEITESVLVQHNEENVELLKRLSATGMQLSLDDFGTGYSSLSYLQRFPINALKIDRSFVHGIDQDENQTALVTAIIAMAQSLRLKVIAEGVESGSQVAFLKEHGCLTVQGYYYSEPVPAADFTALLCEAPYLESRLMAEPVDVVMPGKRPGLQPSDALEYVGECVVDSRLPGEWFPRSAPNKGYAPGTS